MQCCSHETLTRWQIFNKSKADFVPQKNWPYGGKQPNRAFLFCHREMLIKNQWADVASCSNGRSIISYKSYLVKSWLRTLLSLVHYSRALPSFKLCYATNFSFSDDITEILHKIKLSNGNNMLHGRDLCLWMYMVCIKFTWTTFKKGNSLFYGVHFRTFSWTYIKVLESLTVSMVVVEEECYSH